MKKIIYTTLLMIGGVILLGAAGEIKLGKRDGTEPGHTGSPGDTLKNCTVCHGGIAYEIDGWITSDIPSTGYIPGETYNITATNTEHGSTRFGFQVSPQAVNGTLLGTLTITDTTITQLVGNKKYVTYKSAGVDGIDEKSWTFGWTAPAAGTGDVVFYGAFNANPGHKGGDHTYLSKLTIKENTHTGLASVSSNIKAASVYPNPASEMITVSFELKAPAYMKADLVDVTGKLIMVILNGAMSGQVNKTISTAGIPSGVYFIRLTSGGKSGLTRLVISH